MATIRDVAQKANVSVATVSRVLNASGWVNEQTKQKVENAINQLHYRPNDVARSLFKGKSRMIALFVPDIMNPFFPELARAVEDMANQQDYMFILCNTDQDIEKERSYLNALLQKSIDGLIVVSNTLTDEDVQHTTIPIIALDRPISSDIPSVTVNNREGARHAVRYLRQTGCRRIAHIAGPDDVSSAVSRREGYLDESQEESYLTHDLIRSGHYSIDGAYQATKALLETHPDIDGIFAANDVSAIGVIKALESQNKRIPEDISVVGFDGIKNGETTTPALTTMAQPIYDIGKRSFEMLIDKIENPHTTVDSEQYQVELIKRDSAKERRDSHDQAATGLRGRQH